VLCLFSDGVSDQQNENGDYYGRTRLKQCITELFQLPAQEIAERLLDDVTRFRGAIPVHDDQTVVVLKVK
jgi:sigma-B regulation protein RsbU (phosphoserine phosphatase)